MFDSEIPLSVPNLRGNERRYLEECLDTNFISSVGPFVTRFEQAFAATVDAEHAVACASGTAAIHLALLAAGIGRGDDVLVSDFTFIATANPITYCGARPVLVDADSATWNMDAALVAQELDRRATHGLRQPKAVLVAHVLGLPADLAAIKHACDAHGVLVLEDAAESLGASYSAGPLAPRQTGTVGLMGCFSFNGNKIVTTGGGGMVVTADETLAIRARHLSAQAKLRCTEYRHDEVGYNYRLPNIAAALGLAQIERLPEFLARKQAIAARYDAAFKGLPGISVAPRQPWAIPSMWLYSILIQPDAAGLDRHGLLEALERVHIQTRPVWTPLHTMPVYADVPRLGGSVSERLFATGLSLPCSTGLTDTEQERVIDAVLETLNRA